MKLRVEVGLRAKKRVVSLREWLKLYRDTLDYYDDTIYPITIMIAPKEYPDALLTFETHDEKVRIRIPEDDWSYFTRVNDIFDCDIYSKIVYFIARKNHVYIDVRYIDESDITYRYKSNVWRIEDRYAYEYIHSYV